MAEIAIKIGGPEDGSVVESFTDARIGYTHAQMICRNLGDDRLPADRQSNGLCRNDGLLRKWHEVHSEFRLDRISRDEVEIVRLSDKESIRFQNGVVRTGFNGRPQHIWIEEYFSRVYATPRRVMFGSTGYESVYGGRTDVSGAAVDACWEMIERHSLHDRDDYRLWPTGRLDLKHFLFISVEDAQEFEPGQQVQWRDALSLPSAVEMAVEDRDQDVDIRGVPIEIVTREMAWQR